MKKEYHKNKLQREEEKQAEEMPEEAEKSKVLDEYKTEYYKYKDKKASLPKKGALREQFTLDLLAKFKEKLHKAKGEDEETAEVAEKKEAEDEQKWLSHELHFKEDVPSLAKDANTKDDDWFEIYDPRNRLNKRRRGETSKSKS